MTKKKPIRRPNLPQQTLDRARVEARGEQYESPTAVASSDASASPATKTVATAMAGVKAKRAASGSTSSRRTPTQEELNIEYSYVMNDLRTLGLFAGALMVVIVAVAIALPYVIK